MRTFPMRVVWRALALALVLAGASPLAAQTTRDKYEARLRQRSPFNMAAAGETQFTLNINNWLCGINDQGQNCVNTFGSTTGGGGFWPIGTTNQYIFDFGLQIAARDPINPGRFVAMHCFNVSATQASCTPSGQGIFHSDNPADLEAWPEACYLWNPQTGERVKTLSQLDTCVQYTDFDPAFTVPGGHPMGIEVTQHTLAFTLSGFRDMIFFIYKIKNMSHTQAFRDANPQLNVPPGGWTLEDVYVAVGHDADVSSDEVDENFGTFVPFLNPETPLWIGTIWQADFEAADFQPYAQCGFCSNPGFVGTTFLRSPYNTTGDTIRTNVAGVQRVIPPIDKERLEELRLAAARGDTVARDTLKNYEIGQSFASLTTRGGTFPDPEDAAQSWRYYSGNLNDQERAQTVGSPPGFGFVDQPAMADTRYFHATGPFDLAPGDSAEVIVGLVAGAPVLDVPGFTPGTVVDHGLPGDTTRLIERIMGRGRTHTSYPSLFKQVLDARTLFETNFLLPSPPPSPVVTAIPGDRQVALTWTDDPVTAADPYYPVAVQRGIPGFREHDFEGFRVYRKVRPNADWELIAQFDLKNGLTQVITTVDSVITQDGEVVVVRADTANAGTDTGLQFGIIDRGGRFPDPSNGPGLINGVTYYYTVTSYDINSPFAPGGSSLESGQRLTAAPSGIGGAAAKPRSTASGTAAARITPPQLVGNGQVLEVGPPTIDPQTGTFSGQNASANGLQLSLTAYDPLLLTAGEYSVTVDSVVPLNGYEDLLGIHTQEHPNCLGVSTAYFFTVVTPVGTEKVRHEVADPSFEQFGCPESVEEDIFSLSVPADATRAAQYGVDPNHLAGAFSGRLAYGAVDRMSGGEAVEAYRSHQVSEAGGSRWYVGSEPPHPTLDTEAGQLPGVTKIWNGASQYVQNESLRYLVAYLLAPLMRGAEFEVTWGADGEIESVVDLTHNLELPFHEGYRASWGVRNEASGDGILSFGDFWHVTPVSEWWLEDVGAHVPLERTARIQPISSTPPSGFNDNVSSATGMGFGLHIAGELFLFETDQLPPAGTKWRLRTYHGTVDMEVEGADTTYTFTPAEASPPNIVGLTAKIVVEAPAEVVAANASLENVHTVPDPFLATSALQTTSNNRQIMFVNLPPRATIRIYSLSGVLVDAIEHNDPAGGGTAYWDLRNRNNQYVASGVYFYHVSTPDGKQKVGKFTIIQAP